MSSRESRLLASASRSRRSFAMYLASSRTSHRVPEKPVATSVAQPNPKYNYVRPGTGLITRVENTRNAPCDHRSSSRVSYDCFRQSEASTSRSFSEKRVVTSRARVPHLRHAVSRSRSAQRFSHIDHVFFLRNSDRLNHPLRAMAERWIFSINPRILRSRDGL